MNGQLIVKATGQNIQTIKEVLDKINSALRNSSHDLK